MAPSSSTEAKKLAVKKSNSKKPISNSPSLIQLLPAKQKKRFSHNRQKSTCSSFSSSTSSVSNSPPSKRAIKNFIDPRNFDDLVWLCAKIRALANIDNDNSLPSVGIICGSGLGTLADRLEQPRVLPFDQIPGFPKTEVAGHHGNVVFGRLGEKHCICLQGRFHPYEHDMDMALCTMPVRLMALLGVRTLFVSNAAGGISPELKTGDLMVLKDHVFLPGLMGFSPLVGLKDDRFGSRFVSMQNAYDLDLRKKALALAQKLGTPVKEGVYVMCGGPQYETAAECALIARLGGDAVGMSTCHEVTVARQLGIRVFGFSLITNCSSTNSDAPVEVCHTEVLETGRQAGESAAEWIAQLVVELCGEGEEKEEVE